MRSKNCDKVRKKRLQKCTDLFTFFSVQDVRSEKGENESKLTENPG